MMQIADLELVLGVQASTPACRPTLSIISVADHVGKPCGRGRLRSQHQFQIKNQQSKEV